MRKLVHCLTWGLAALLVFQANAYGQSAMNLQWDELGPNNKGAHIRSIYVASDGTVWAGATGGGLWKSVNGGSSWSQVTDVADNMVVSCIAGDGNNIYVGTGEVFYYTPESSVFPNWQHGNVATVTAGFFSYAGLTGQGVFVSNDGGSTWNHNNGTWNASSTLFDDSFMSIQAISTSGGRTMIATLEGLYYSDDAGLATVTKATGTSAFESAVITDVKFANGTTVLAASRDSVYRSTNNGTSFGSAFNADVPVDPNPGPFNRVGGDRIMFAVAPSNADIVYLTGASSVNGDATGVWKSTDNGVTWTRVAPYESGTYAPFDGAGRYSMVLEVYPDDPDAFLIGGSNLYTYNDADGLIDAASHFYIPGFSTNYVPTPQFQIAFDPNNSDVLYIATEEEVVRSDDRGDTYAFRTKGLNAGHFYSVSAAPNYKVMGSSHQSQLLYKNNANSTSGQQQFTAIGTSSQDGIARFSLTNMDYIVAQVADGGLSRSFNNGENFEEFYGVPIYPIPSCLGSDSLYVDRADSTSGGGGVYDAGLPKINPWVLDEVISPSALQVDSLIEETPVYLYMASRHFIWVCTNPFGGVDSLPNWNRLIPDMINDAASPREYFTAIAVSGDNNHVVYAGTNYGKIIRIYNANDPTNLDCVNDIAQVDGAGMPQRWITDIEFDPKDPNNLIVTYGALPSGDDRVWITNDALNTSGTPTFRSYQGDLMADLPVYSAAFHPGMDAILIGTEFGVYTNTQDYTSVNSPTWNKESNGPGNVRVNDIYIRPYYQLWVNPSFWRYAPDHTIFIATEGRGIFKSSSAVANEEPVVMPGYEVSLFPNPTAGASTVSFTLPEAAAVEMSVYSIDGRLVERAGSRSFTAGNHELSLNSDRFGSGMYLVKFTATGSSGVYTKTLKAVVME